jgi:hypothetical protein
MTNKRNAVRLITVAAALFIGGTSDARADIIDTVTVDTSTLLSIPGSEIFFVLTDGSGTGDANNTATLSSFGFGGGSAGTLDLPSTTGGVSGDITSTASITDSAFTNVLAQFFTAGSAISFNLDLTTNVDAGPTPDQFSFAIFDPSGNPIPTSDPTGDDNLLVININSSNPTLVSYSDIVTITPPGAVPTPEPRQLVFLIAILLLLVFLPSRDRKGAPFCLEKLGFENLTGGRRLEQADAGCLPEKKETLCLAVG